MNSKNRGFTLIELMIVIAIISILTTSAIPSYQDQVIRAQVQEALNLSEVAKKQVELYYTMNHKMPKDNADALLPSPEKLIGNFVSSIIVKNGVINIRLGNRININAAKKVISIRPAIVKDEPIVPIAWICGYASVPKGMSVVGGNETTILSRHLPMAGRF